MLRVARVRTGTRVAPPAPGGTIARMVRVALVALVMVFGLHHVGILTVPAAGHHGSACASCAGDHASEAVGGVLATCLALLAVALTVPAARRRVLGVLRVRATRGGGAGQSRVGRLDSPRGPPPRLAGHCVLRC